MAYLTLIALVAGLLMYMLSSNTKVIDIGRMIFFAAAIGLMVAMAPATAHLLHGG